MEQDLISEIIRSKRRTLALEITPDARLIIRAPLRASMESIHRIISKKRSWILEKQEKARERYKPIRAYQFIDGEEFLYLGNSCKLRVVSDWNKPFEFKDSEFLIGEQFLAHARRFFEDWYINQAREVITSRVKFYTQISGQSYSKIRINKARTRWGSCSFRKTLNFNWRLIMAPLDQIDYVVLHEVAHLQELNHSARFWNKVQMFMPDYKKREQWFRDNQHMLRFD